MEAVRIPTFSPRSRSITKRQSQRCIHKRNVRRVTSTEPDNFWHRVQEAWRVLSGSKSPHKTGTGRMKQRFSRLLVTDRGFDADKLAHFYNLAKTAISEHVVLEEGHEKGIARVEKLGVLNFEFNIKRIKSSPYEESWAQPTLIEYEPNASSTNS